MEEENATEQEIKDTKIANADNFINRFPNGYLSEIGERGSSFPEVKNKGLP